MTVGTRRVSTRREQCGRAAATPSSFPRRQALGRARAAVAGGVLVAITAAPAWALDGPPAPGAQQQSAASTPSPVDRPAGGYAAPTFSDDTVMLVWGPAYRNPAIKDVTHPDGADIARAGIEFKHIDNWKYGHNFVEVVIKKSNHVEPAAGGGDGALGLYAIFRAGLGLNKMAGRRVVGWGPLRDVVMQAGLNLESKNTAYAPQERTLYFGPNLQFGVGRGFVNIGVHLRREWNHNGILGVTERFDPNLNIEPVWHVPFSVGRIRLSVDGHADFNTPKGKDAAGHETRPEFLTRPLLRVDLGSVVGSSNRTFELGVGFEYWRNMYGKDARDVPGANEFAPLVSLTVHLPVRAGSR